ncbi:MAG: hypothetical protein R2695_14090 [Acidimicrobiales bacterium]
MALATGGRPPFWFWYVTVGVFGSFTTVTTPTYTAQAMTPMGQWRARPAA